MAAFLFLLGLATSLNPATSGSDVLVSPVLEANPGAAASIAEIGATVGNDKAKLVTVGYSGNGHEAHGTILKFEEEANLFLLGAAHEFIYVMYTGGNPSKISAISYRNSRIPEGEFKAGRIYFASQYFATGHHDAALIELVGSSKYYEPKGKKQAETLYFEDSGYTIVEVGNAQSLGGLNLVGTDIQDEGNDRYYLNGASAPGQSGSPLFNGKGLCAVDHGVEDGGHPVADGKFVVDAVHGLALHSIDPTAASADFYAYEQHNTALPHPFANYYANPAETLTLENVKIVKGIEL